MDGWQKLSFDATIAVLQGWLGKKIAVSIDAAGGPMHVGFMSGTLRAGADMSNPPDEEEFSFGFEEMPEAEFAVHRNPWFHGASLKDDKLVVAVGAEGEVLLEIERLE